jgi:formamidopyrimidine-DNA glycosylase
MPELPEVETICRALKPILEGQTFQNIHMNRTDLRYPLPFHLTETLCHQPITTVSRRAKYLLIDFAHGWTLIWHLGMSGRIIVEDLTTPCREPHRHDHVIFYTSHHYRLTYHDPRRFGFLLMSPTSQVTELSPFDQLGPEPLTPLDILLPLLQKRLRHRLLAIKTALLDQQVIAGIGNIYASEALWQARISPLRPAHSLSTVEVKRLLQALQDILQRAIAAGGSTLHDHRHPNGEIGYFQYQLKAYGRDGASCLHCHRMALSKIIQNGRATYYCPQCQQ